MTSGSGFPERLRKLAELESGDYTRWNVIPNLSVVASYSFTTQTIELAEVSAQRYMGALSGDPAAQNKVLPLLLHEWRHWLDHIGTVWGQRLLTLGYNAIHARLAGKETDFRRIVDFRRKLRDDRFEKFYSEIYKQDDPAQAVRGWRYEFSTGARFDHNGVPSEEHPIIFTRFRWLGGSLACRVPLSVASLLETSAMHFEFEAESVTIGNLSEDEQQNALEALQTRYLDNFYKPALTDYSVAAHAVSNIVGPSDVPRCLQLSSALANVALNLVDHHFDLLKIPSRFENWGKRNQALLLNRNRGYAFLCLCCHAPQNPESSTVLKVEQQALTASEKELLGDLLPTWSADMAEMQLSSNKLSWWGSHLLGLFFTLVALSMGAPFWFDMLNKFINIRNSGKAPDRASAQPPSPPAQVAAKGAGV